MKKINIIFFIISLILVNHIFAGKNRISVLKDEAKQHSTNIKKVIKRVNKKRAELERRKARLEELKKLKRLPRFQSRYEFERIMKEVNLKKDKDLAEIINKLDSFEID